MKTIAYIIPYFGKLPEMFDLWLKSCALNPTIDWLLFTNDKTEHQYPNNVKVTYMTFTELVSKIQSKFPFKILVGYLTVVFCFASLVDVNRFLTKYVTFSNFFDSCFFFFDSLS